MNFLNTAAYAGNILSAKQAADAKAAELALEQQKVAMTQQDLQAQQQAQQFLTDPDIASFFDGSIVPSAQPMPQGVTAAPPAAQSGPSVPTPMPQGAMSGPLPAYGPNGTPVPGQAPPPRPAPAQGGPAGPPTATPMQQPQAPQQPAQAPQQPPMSQAQQLLQYMQKKNPYMSPAAKNLVMQQFSKVQGQRQEALEKQHEFEEKQQDSRDQHEQTYDARMQEAQSKMIMAQSANYMRQEHEDFMRSQAQDREQDKKRTAEETAKADEDKHNKAMLAISSDALAKVTKQLDTINEKEGIPSPPSHGMFASGGSYEQQKAKYDQYQALMRQQKMLLVTTQRQYNKLNGMPENYGVDADDTSAPAAGGSNPPPSGMVTVTDPSGKVGQIPAAQLKDALAQGYKQAQ